MFTKFLNDLPLRDKLMLSYFIILLLALSMFGGFAFQRSTVVIKQQVEASTDQIIMQAKNNLESYMREVWFKKTVEMEGRMYWYADKDQVCVARLIVDVNDPGRFLGIIQAKVDINQFFGEVGKIKIGKTGRVFLVDDDRIITPTDNELVKILDNEPTFFSEIYRSANGSTFKTFNDKEYLIVYEELSGTKWKLIGMVPTIELVENVGVIRNALFLIGAISLVVASISSVFISYRISGPIHALADCMKNFDVDQYTGVSVHSNDEIGEIYNSFNKMVKRIQQLIKEVSEQSRREKEAELRALQAQINSHFLYNTLDSIARGKDITPATQKMLEAFEDKYPNIKVNYQEMPSQSDQQHNAFVTALSAGDDSVDVYRLDIIWPSEFASAGWILPLDDYFSEEEREKFLQGPIQGCTYNGSIYAVPLYTDAGVLYYRKDLIPNPPETWNELYSIGKKLMDEGKVEYGFVFQANQYEGLVCNVLEYIHSNGGKVIDGSNVVLNSENAIEALNIFKKMLDIAPEGVTTYIENDGGVMFQEGKVAFMRNWPSWWSNLNSDESAVKGKVGVAPIPKGPNGDATGKATLGGWNLAINKNSKNKDAAWTFIEFMTSEEAQKIQAIEGGFLPDKQPREFLSCKNAVA